jgi:ribosome-associated heat shock protein Hsp15
MKVGDALSIQRGEEQFDVTVAQLGTRRGPATEAQRLYVESEASRARRARDTERRRLAAEARVTRQGRPTKRDRRRQIRQFRDGLE